MGKWYIVDQSEDKKEPFCSDESIIKWKPFKYIDGQVLFLDEIKPEDRGYTPEPPLDLEFDDLDYDPHNAHIPKEIQNAINKLDEREYNDYAQAIESKKKIKKDSIQRRKGREQFKIDPIDGDLFKDPERSGL